MMSSSLRRAGPGGRQHGGELRGGRGLGGLDRLARGLAASVAAWIVLGQTGLGAILGPGVRAGGAWRLVLREQRGQRAGRHRQARRHRDQQRQGQQPAQRQLPVQVARGGGGAAQRERQQAGQQEQQRALQEQVGDQRQHEGRRHVSVLPCGPAR